MKKITAKQLRRAIKTAPRQVMIDGKDFLVAGLAEYKRVAVQGTPWRVGGSGGAIPRRKGNLREKHRTAISGLSGKFGVNPTAVKYAKYVHDGTRYMDARPWLDHAKQRGDKGVEKHYQILVDKILKHIAT